MTAITTSNSTNVKPSVGQNFGLTDFPPVRVQSASISFFLVTIVWLESQVRG